MALKINLPLSINSLDEAVEYLTLLHNSGYAYHCDDTIFNGTPEGNIRWSLKEDNDCPNMTEQMHMDTLMDQVHEYHDDPCLVLLELLMVPVVMCTNENLIDLYNESGQFVEGDFESEYEADVWCEENNYKVVKLFNTK